MTPPSSHSHGLGRFSSTGTPMPVMAEINMTPFVDVMLVLLVMLILTAPLLTHAIRLKLPEAAARAAAPTDSATPIVLSLDAQGQLFWNDTALPDSADLLTRLTETARQHPERAVHIRADQQVRYQAVAALLAQLQQTGIANIGFVITPTPDAPGSKRQP